MRICTGIYAKIEREVKKTMTLTIEISPELEEKLEAEAESKGIGKDELARHVLEEKLNLQQTKRKKPPFESRIIATDLPNKDYSRQHKWLEQNREEYDGQWIALDGDKLIAADFDGSEVAKKVHKLGINGAYVVFVESANRPRFISGGIW